MEHRNEKRHRVDNKTKGTGGKAGTGKSLWAAQVEEPCRQYRKNSSSWCDGYCQELHKVVIIEEIDTKIASFLTGHINISADRYSFTGEIKGGSAQRS
jgi:hypothetical protein